MYYFSFSKGKIITNYFSPNPTHDLSPVLHGSIPFESTIYRDAPMPDVIEVYFYRIMSLFQRKFVLICMICFGFLIFYHFFNNQHFRSLRRLKFKVFYSTTIVTAFFRLQGHARSGEEYNVWAKHMLSEVNDNLVVFTSSDEVAWLRSLRGNRPMVLHIFNTIYHWPWASHYRAEFNRQHSLDDQPQNRMNPDVYAIWNSKPSFMAYAAERNDFNSEYFFWVDIGSRREYGFNFSKWPNQMRVSELFERGENRLLLSLISTVDFSWDYRRRGSQYPHVGIQGGFFAGTRNAVIRFNHTYTQYLNLFINLGSFVGSDQGVLSGLVAVDSLKQDFMALDARENACGIDKWFYFYHFFKRGNDGLVNCEEDLKWPVASVIRWDAGPPESIF
jgi:hypothetical protein